ncbi:hypothetical protein [Rhizobium setariae]|nr:hypothetical protein [Rhizobium setariae]
MVAGKTAAEAVDMPQVRTEREALLDNMPTTGKGFPVIEGIV